MLRPGLVAWVWIGCVVLAVLGVLWLQIPDSHVWQFGFAMMSACALLALLFWFWCGIFRRMLQTQEGAAWWLRWVLLAVVIFVWWLLQMPIDRLVEHRELYAGYWTSKLPHGMRWLRTYEHLLLLQAWMYFSLRLIVTGLLLPVAMVAGASGFRAGVGRILRLWLRWWYWLAVLVCGWIGFMVSGSMIDWTPRHGLAGEILSLLARMGFVFTLDVVLACFVLAVAAVGLRQRGTAIDKG
jgi:hypothetical protein